MISFFHLVRTELMSFKNFSSYSFYHQFFIRSAPHRELEVEKMVKPKKPTMMREYFKCKECFMEIWEKRIAKHHSKAHPRVPHEVYVDTYFDLNRPLFKCDCCSIKLGVTDLVKHRRLAHRHKDNSFLKYKLPIIEYLQRNRLKAQSVTNKLTPVIDLVSDASDLSDISETEDGEISDNESKAKSKDQAVQSQPKPALPKEPSKPSVKCVETQTTLDVADKCVGEHCETSDKSTNTANDKEFQDICTQTVKEKPKPRTLPILPAMNIGVECDEDGFLELVLF